jgi:hypothetical protein
MTMIYIWSWNPPLNVTVQFDSGSDDLAILEACISSTATNATTTKVPSRKVHDCQKPAKKRQRSTAAATSDENEEVI